MGSKAGTASVIAKLMGLDDLPNQHPIRKRGRVLSEKYFQRVASIGVRERSPSPEKHSFGPTERPEGFGAFIRVVGMPGQDKHYMKETESKTLRLNQNVKSGQSEETSNASETFSEPPHIPTKIVLLRPRCGAEEISSSDFSLLRPSQTSAAGRMKSRDSYGSLRYRRDSSHEIEVLGQRPRVLTEEVEEVSKQVKFSNMQYRSSSAPDVKKSQNGSSVSSSNSSYIAREAKKEISERFMITKEFQELGSGSRGKTLGEMLSMHTQKMGPRCVNYSSHDSGRGMKNGTHDINRFKRSKVSLQPFAYNSKDRDSSYKEGLQTGKVASPCKNSRNSCSLDPEHNSSISGLVVNNDNLRNEAKDVFAEKNVAMLSTEEAEISGSSLGAPTSLSEILGWTSQMESVSSSNSSENLQKEEEPSQFLEGDSVSTHSSMGFESFKSFEETYQPSPDSVLEPFDEEISSDMRNDLAGMKILPLKLESIGVRLEEHRMTISSYEEDDDDRSASNFKEAEDFMRFSKAAESRDFLYLVDVLCEAGLHVGNLIENLIKWHSTESLVSSLVFEILEKKYGEQKSWRRSERKLLFDRINFGLMEMLLQGTIMPSWAKPLSTRFNSRPGTELTEESLWALLVRQENKARKEPENVLGDDLGWSDIGECVDFVRREIEESLVEELAAEFF